MTMTLRPSNKTLKEFFKSDIKIALKDCELNNYKKKLNRITEISLKIAFGRNNEDKKESLVNQLQKEIKKISKEDPYLEGRLFAYAGRFNQFADSFVNLKKF